MNNGHILYTKDDFKNWTAEQIEKNNIANAVMNWSFNVCKNCGEYEAGLDTQCYPSRPYSQTDYEAAQEQGLDLDDWNDYQKFYRLGEQEEYE